MLLRTTGSLLTKHTTELRSCDKRYSAHAVEFRGNLVGNITGTVTGGAANANKLTSVSNFELTGDVSSNVPSLMDKLVVLQKLLTHL